MDKIKYVFFDLDGTLLNDEHKISQNSLKIINQIRNKDIKIGIITGRPQCMIKNEVDKIKPDLPICGINGTLILNKHHDFKSPIFQKEVDTEDLKKISDFIFKNKISALFYSIDKMLVIDPFGDSNHIKKLKNMIDGYPKEFKWDFEKILSFEDIKNIKIFKILVIIEKRSVDFIEDLKKSVFPLHKSYYVKSQNHLLDIMSKDTSKGKALEILEKNNFIDLNKTIVFGDQENDISMFSKVNVSVAMKNAGTKVKKHAKFVTKYTNNEDGATNFLLDFIK